MKEGSGKGTSLSVGARRTWREGPFTRGLEGYVMEERSVNRHLSP